MSSSASDSRFAGIGAVLAVVLMAVSPATAQDQSGTWNVAGGGSWATAGNWTGSNIANGAGSTATFGGGLTGTWTVTLDGARTIGNITFSDTTPLATDVWAVSTGTGGPLTLDVTTGSPTLTANTAVNISAVLAGSDGLTKAGAGTMFVAGANTYSGITNVNTATFEVMSANALGATGAGNHTVVASGARVRIGADVTTSEDFFVAGNGVAGAINFGSSQSGVTVSTATIAGLVTLTAATRIDSATDCIGTFDRGGAGNSVDLATFTGTFSGGGTTYIKSPVVGSSGTFRLNGSGNAILTATNTYGGQTNVTNNGTLQLGDGGTGGSLSTSSPISLSTLASTFAVNQSDTVTQGVDFSGAAITAAVGGPNIGNFTQAGTGTTILTANNSYRGTTNVNAGTLLINGNHNGTDGSVGLVTVAAGARLGGTGSVNGAVTVNGFLAPGASAGVFTAATVTLNGSSTSLFEIDATGRGTGYDGLTITSAGGLTYGGALALVFGNGSAFANDTTFDLFSFTGTPSGNFSSVSSTGFYAGTWTFASGEWSLTQGEQKLTFTPSTGDLVVAVPEPSTLVLLGGLAAAGVFVRRRRA